MELPGPGRTISTVSMELGQVLAPCGIYNYAGGVAVYANSSKTLDPIKPAKFRTWSEKFIIPVKAGDKGEVIQTMSSGDAGTILLSEQFIEQLREVDRFNGVRLPVMRENGTVELLPEGYDRDSKILTATETLPYPTNTKPEEGKAFLDDLLKEFPFMDEGRSKAVAVAAMLTMYGLDLMPPRTILPAFKYRGNLPGLGKGLLAQAAMIPVLGYAPTGVKPKDETEMRKILFAVAREARPGVFLDNVTGRLASPSLESFITTSMVTGRVLGTSISLNCRKATVVFITGHNCTLNADMARRTLICELFMAGAPESRKIENHLDENRLLELRPQILGSLYALVNQWALAGKPKPSATNPNFVVWSQIIGAIVEHAGFGSVATTTAEDTVADPREVDMFALTEHLHTEHQTEAVKFTDLVSLMREHNLFSDILKSGETLNKHENTAMGRFLSAQHDRAFTNGLRFVILGKGHARRYAVQRLSGLLEAPVTSAA